MKLKFEIDTNLLQEIDSWKNKTLPRERRELVTKSMQATLADIIQHTPVDTGRTKNAWQEATTATNISHSEDTTEATATNAVPYISYLEYGTKNMPPFATIRNALLNLRQTIGTFLNES